MTAEPVDVQLPKNVGTAYVVERELGRGGMATVYLARDTKHDRRVAVKVLHPALIGAVAVERFLREIRIAATLQHPHILGLIDSGVLGNEWGDSAGVPYYVMPFVEGESLRARLDRERQLHVAEAVRLTGEVAGALDYAHRQGVVHRDIKPENVLLQGGHALVADFGIALAIEQAGGSRLTGTGLSLGTPHYMAPEQAAGGRIVNASADIYALGVLTYEMLVGEPPFTGPSPQAVLARALTEEPRPLTATRRTVPEHVDRAVRTALEKLPADRFSSAAQYAAALAEPAGPGAASPRRVSASDRRRTFLLGTALTVAALGIGIALGRAGRPTKPIGSEPVRFVIQPDSGFIPISGIAVSPDGATIVYPLEKVTGATLHMRRVGEMESREIPGTSGGGAPMFSPDGHWIAFVANGAIRKVRLDGGGLATISAAVAARSFSVGSWAWDDGIYFCTQSGDLYRVSSGSGEMKRVFAADSTKRIASVQLLSNRKTALVTLRREGPERRIGVLDLGSGVVRELGAGFAPHYAMGQLLFADLEGRLYTQPFDVGTMALTGTARQISDMVGGNFFSVPLFDVSPTGSIVYRANPGGTFTLSIVDRAGQRLLALPGHRPWGPRFSPDGRRVAYAAVARDQTRSDIWIADLESGTTQRFTTDGNENDDAQWSPDGRVIVYSADAEGGKDMFQQRLDGGAPRPVLRRPGDQWPSDWSGIGNLLLFTEVKADVSMGVWVQPLDSGAPRAYVDEPSNEKGGRLSPNGKWVAYTSDETGQEEIYLQPFPTPGPRTVVSVGGGVDPVWRGDSQELYYFRGDQLIAVSLVPGAPGQPLIVRSRTPLFVTPYVHFANANYDVSPDGKRFVLLGESGRGNRVVVWLHALDALAESRAPDEQRP